MSQIHNTGYADRFTEGQLNSIRDYEWIFVEEVWGDDVFCGTGRLSTERKSKIEHIRTTLSRADIPFAGSVAFECQSLGEAMDIAERLMEFNHCGMFHFSSLIHIAVVDDILFMCFDCESG